MNETALQCTLPALVVILSFIAIITSNKGEEKILKTNKTLEFMEKTFLRILPNSLKKFL